MKKVAFLLVLTGWFIGSYATDARVFTMGGNDNFYMDDYSIFRNPANINYYPNMLLGSPGVYLLDKADEGKNSALDRKNTDPQKPYYGLIMSYSMNQSAESGTQYPLLSVGAIFNRYDAMLDYLDPKSDVLTKVHQKEGFTKNSKMLTPVGKLDFMLGYAMQNGMMIGGGTYLAFQKQDTAGYSLESSIYRGNVGINVPVAKSMNLEVSADISSLTGIALDSTSSTAGNTNVTPDTIADNNISVKGDIRLFSALTSLNGDFVPHLGVNYTSLKNYSNIEVAAGLGVNVNIDKGFFWAGLEGLYDSKTYTKKTDSLPSGIGGRISAGLERNVIFDWLVLRIGVNKRLMYVSNGDASGHWEQNPEADASNDDNLALGLGLNIENRLKVDAVLAEDMVYTFTNLISGASHHLTNRITATYSF